ncbi:recombinase family protein [Zavarzinella formosa]|uniref:recombinase family protein n=1 Tax=Zavarzinella formosa TaxID=360055 RepID=UPI0002D8D3BC|nr:recombinase family protein [Zavarzinella formosa]
MSRRSPAALPVPNAERVRCAIYTRKSTEEGLDAEFNSLDAQREAGEAFVASQKHEGWTILDTRYDDGGYSGGSMERPALKRLLDDMAAGRIDCVVVYKVDRLSRSLLDFARLMDQFERQRVSFVAVTQQFNSATSMGRLVLNVLLSFAQFEREIIGERTRDKMAAMRRKGKWIGGLTPLGYDRDPVNSRLVINHEEAERVRAIFQLYLDHGSLLPVVEELGERGWANKRTVTRRGTTRGGQAITRTSLHRLLTNVVYIGQIQYRNELHAGEHSAIIDHETFRKVQSQMHRHGTTGGAEVRNPSKAMLQKVLRCAACDCFMSPTHTKKGNKRYGYYVCTNAAKNGHRTCPSKSIPAGGIERAVVDRIRLIGRDPALIRETVRQARELDEARHREDDAEIRSLERERNQGESVVRELSLRLAGTADPTILRQLADWQERLGQLETRLLKATARRDSNQRPGLPEHEAREALARFDDVWDQLTPKERSKIVRLLVDRVDYDGRARTVSLTFHPDGLAALTAETQPRDNSR